MPMLVNPYRYGGAGFKVAEHTGNGTSQSVVVPLAMDTAGGLSLIKNRVDASDIIVVDTVRGATKYLATNQATAEATDATKVSAFTGNGFSVGSDNATNGNGDAIVSFNWLRRQKLLDIVEYNGTGSNQSIAHNLGVVPKLIIVRSLDTFGNWCIKSSSLADNRVLFFNSGTGETNNNYWNNTAATSTHFSVGTNVLTNRNANRFIAYLFGDVTGAAHHDAYTGNGSVTGPTITAGFRPSAWFIKGENVPGACHFCFVDGSDIYSIDLGDNDAQVSKTGKFTVSATGLQITATDSDLNTDTELYISSLWR